MASISAISGDIIRQQVGEAGAVVGIAGSSIALVVEVRAVLFGPRAQPGRAGVSLCGGAYCSPGSTGAARRTDAPDHGWAHGVVVI